MDPKLFTLLMFSAFVQGQFYEDRRCRCICPSPSSVINTSNIIRQVYTGNVPPNKCDCQNVVLPIIGQEILDKEALFCPRCDCVFQTRNTTIIMITVFVLIWAITLLLSYMVFLRIINPWAGFNRDKMRHLRHHNSTEEVLQQDEGAAVIIVRRPVIPENKEFNELQTVEARRSSMESDDWQSCVEYPVRDSTSPSIHIKSQNLPPHSRRTSARKNSRRRSSTSVDPTVIIPGPRIRRRGENCPMLLRQIDRVNYKRFF